MSGQRPESTAALSRDALQLRQALRKPLPEIPSKYLYDERGSELYEQITHEPEYYQTRTEFTILEGAVPELAKELAPREYVELGSGSGRKTELFIAGLPDLESVLLLDISGEFLDDSVARVRARHPELTVRGLEADFVHDLSRLGPGGGRLMTFFAGTLGNLHPDEVPGFLRRAAAQMEPGDGLLVGIDLVKDPAVLEAAYNDAAGVTAAFNLNILNVLNERFGGDLPVDDFEHHAFYDTQHEWIDIRVRAKRRVRARLEALDLDLVLGMGDEIRTELSCKYSLDSLRRRSEGTGLAMRRVFTDPEGLFADVLLVRTEG